MSTPSSPTPRNAFSMHLQPHDSILDIISRIREESGEHREVRIDLGDNVVFRHYLAIRLLISSFPAKKFIFLTSDASLRKIGEPLGVKYYYRNDSIEFEETFAKQNILRHNFTAWEYVMYELRKGFAFFGYWLARRSSVYRRARFISDTNTLLLLIGVGLSVGLLVFIFYFAVSRTYIYITPELSVKTVSRNLLYREEANTGSALAGNATDNNIISVHPFAIDYALDHTFNISTYDTGSTVNAHGTIEITNELPQEQVFRPNSRLITAEGLVYRTQDWIKIPGETTESGVVKPWVITADMIADMYDLNGNVIGSRGNIGDNVLLTFPGLKFSRDKVYAHTKGAIAGGTDPTVHLLTNSELGQFKDTLGQKLHDDGYEQLKSALKTYNRDNASDYDILPVADDLSYEPGDITIMNGTKIGDRVSEVTLHGTIHISSHIFDRRATLFYLRTILNESLLYSTERLNSINEDSLRITNVISRTDGGPFTMKATTELDASIAYNFEDPSNNLTKKLKNLILGMSATEAKSTLLNNPSISGVQIQFSPFWMIRVSNHPDNIDFIIEGGGK